PRDSLIRFPRPRSQHPRTARGLRCHPQELLAQTRLADSLVALHNDRSGLRGLDCTPSRCQLIEGSGPTHEIRREQRGRARTGPGASVGAGTLADLTLELKESRRWLFRAIALQLRDEPGVARGRLVVPARQAQRFHEAMMSALVQGGSLDPPLGEAHRVRPIACALRLDHQPIAGGDQAPAEPLPLSFHPVAEVLSANVVRAEEKLAV